MRRLLHNIICISMAVILGCTTAGCAPETKETAAATAEEQPKMPKELVLWYTNEALTPYLTEAAAAYEAEKKASVTAVLVSPIDYIEKIHEASLKEEAVPDLFIAENSELERLYLAGLSKENTDMSYRLRFQENTLEAFTYKDKLYGYPLYFETAYLLYHKQYVDKIPQTLDDILAFAESFESDGNLESVLEWDVDDILCNYFFAGAYLDYNEPGMENYITDMERLTESLQYYQDLHQYFAIDSDIVTYDTAVRDFLDGKTVFTIAKTDRLPEFAKSRGTAEIIGAGRISSYSAGAQRVLDAVRDMAEPLEGQVKSANLPGAAGAGILWKLEEAKQEEAPTEEESAQTDLAEGDNGEESPYGIAPLPGLTAGLPGRGLAVNYGLFVNGYTDQQEEAEDFAVYLTDTRAAGLYEASGKLAARKDIDYKNENIANVIRQYEKAAIVPRVMENKDFWLSMEIAFSNIWKGTAVSEALAELSR